MQIEYNFCRCLTNHLKSPMNLNTQRQKTKYTDVVRFMLSKYYGYGDLKSPKSKQLNDEIGGFFKAGVLLEIVTNEELQQLVDEEHLLAFGKTIKQRRIEEKTGVKSTERNWDIYDSPSINRK